jgi:type VI secretion system ImpM family protein
MLRKVSEPMISLLGKVPAALDFVRVNHDRPEAMQIDRWLQTGLQRLAARGQDWPESCLRFAAVTHNTQIVGVVGPSRDRAGRSFPLALYTCLGSDAPGGLTAALPLASERFARDAQELLGDAHELSLSQLRAALQRVCGPRAQELSAARAELHEQLTRQTLAGFTARVFEDVPLAMANEAFQRVLQGPRGFDCCDCPARSALDVATWARLLELSQAPLWSCVWNVTDAAPRALIARTQLPERAPLFWATPAVKHPQLCRLDQGALNVHGRLSYAPLSGTETLAALFERLVREPKG